MLREELPEPDWPMLPVNGVLSVVLEGWSGSSRSSRSAVWGGDVSYTIQAWAGKGNIATIIGIDEILFYARVVRRLPAWEHSCHCVGVQLRSGGSAAVGSRMELARRQI